MVGGKSVDEHRNLGNAVKRTCDLNGRGFHRIGGVPHEHIGVDGGFSGGEAQIDDSAAVPNRIGGAVAHAEHIAVFADGRSDVALAEFNENVGAYGGERGFYAGHKRVHGFLEGRDVAAGVGFKGFTGEAEGVDEVELQTVEPEALDRVGINSREIFSDFGVPGVEGEVRAVVPGAVKEHIPEFAVLFGMDAHERDAVPEHDFHSDGVQTVYKGAHAAYLFFGDLPVSAEGVSAAVVVGLPPIVDDDRLHAKRFGKAALGQNLRNVEALVEAVPEGVHGQTRRFGDGSGGVAAVFFPPGHSVVYAVVIVDAAKVDADERAVFAQRSGGAGEEFYAAFQICVLFTDSGGYVNGRCGVGHGDADPVFSGEGDDLVNRHP